MWAVMFEVEEGELMYDTGKPMFTINDDPLVFYNKDEAIAQAKLWNTGIVVPYIRPMSDEERQQSKVRGKQS